MKFYDNHGLLLLLYLLYYLSFYLVVIVIILSLFDNVSLYESNWLYLFFLPRVGLSITH